MKQRYLDDDLQVAGCRGNGVDKPVAACHMYIYVHIYYTIYDGAWWGDAWGEMVELVFGEFLLQLFFAHLRNPCFGIEQLVIFGLKVACFRIIEPALENLPNFTTGFQHYKFPIRVATLLTQTQCSIVVTSLKVQATHPFPWPDSKNWTSRSTERSD